MTLESITTADDFIQNQISEKPERTFGLKAVDGLIYPIINYGGVFALSVGSLYLGKHGAEVADYFDDIAKNHADDKLISGVSLIASWGAENFQKRSSGIDNWLVDNVGMNQQSAEVTRMVVTSFVDGCFFLPAVKWLEDRRIGLAKAIDNVAGTRPDTDAVYEAEPNKTWGDLIIGRAATAAIVVPTAVILDKVPINIGGNNQPLNQYLFYDQADNVQNFLQQNIPSITEKLTEEQLNTISQNVLFEGFYTMVCSVGLWGASSFLANNHKEQENKNINSEIAENNIKPFKRIKSDDILFDGKASKIAEPMLGV
jgi:hypothetical protein